MGTTAWESENFPLEDVDLQCTDSEALQDTGFEENCCLSQLHLGGINLHVTSQGIHPIQLAVVQEETVYLYLTGQEATVYLSLAGYLLPPLLL